MLPTRPVFFGKPQPIRWQELEKDEDWTGITHQDSRPGKDEILAVIPPNDAYGVSLWGQSGDASQVQVVFRVNLSSRMVEAWNECT